MFCLMFVYWLDVSPRTLCVLSRCFTMEQQTLPAPSLLVLKRPVLKVFAHEPLEMWTHLSLLMAAPQCQTCPRAHIRHAVKLSEEAKEKQLCPSLFMEH